MEKDGIALWPMETLKSTKGAVVDLLMNWESFWWKCLTLDNTKCWDLKWESPVLRPGCRAPWHLGFGWLMLLRHLVHKVWQCCAVPLLILLAPGHAHGSGALLGRNFFTFFAVLVPATTFVASPQLLAWRGNLTHGGEREKASYCNQGVLKEQFSIETFYLPSHL